MELVRSATAMTQGPVTFSGTINMPYAPTPAPQQLAPPVPNQCFLCIRQNKYGLAITVYKATYLCMDCVRSLPNEIIINEFPPTP